LVYFGPVISEEKITISTNSVIVINKIIVTRSTNLQIILMDAFLLHVPGLHVYISHPLPYKNKFILHLNSSTITILSIFYTILVDYLGAVVAAIIW
jgi:hypothetical protein